MVDVAAPVRASAGGMPLAWCSDMTSDDAGKLDDWELFSAIRKEELAGAIQASRVQVINVLEAPKKGRLRLIAHSRHIPLSELEARLGELDRGRDVVVYCKNRECPASLKAARLLAERGFHVRAYEGGIEEWVQAGLPTDADAKKLPRTETAASDAPPSTMRTPSESASADAEAASKQERRADAWPTAEPADPPEDAEEAGNAAEKPAARSGDGPKEDASSTPRASAVASASDEDAGEPAESSMREPATSFLDCLSTSPDSERGA